MAGEALESRIGFITGLAGLFAFAGAMAMGEWTCAHDDGIASVTIATPPTKGCLVILLCYDGSADAQSAIDHAGELLSGQSVTVWEPFIERMTHTGTGLGLGAAPLNVEEIDSASKRAAQERAEEGAERARQAGLNAKPRTSARGATIAHTILSAADEPVLEPSSSAPTA